jgi:cyanuric acid amidohydrolase
MFVSAIFKIALDSPSDTEGLANLITEGKINPADIIGMIFTLEGDDLAGVQTTLAYTTFLAEQLGVSRQEILKRIPLIACRGLTGLMIPHVAVFTRKVVKGQETGKKRLVVASATTRTFLPEEMGTKIHIDEIAERIRSLMGEVGITDPGDVRLVWVKNHWGTFKPTYGWLDRAIADAARRNKKLIVENYAALGERIRACGALAVGVALGDIDPDTITNGNITENYNTVYTTRALASAGNEHPEPTCQIILFGNSSKSASKAVIRNGLMKDALDHDGVKAVLREAGLQFTCCPSQQELEKIIYTFLGSGLHATKTIRGHRHTLAAGSPYAQYHWTIQKAPAHAVVAALIGDPVIEVCSSVEHTHPPDAQPIFVIARTED